MVVVKLISHSINHLYSSTNISKTVKKSEMYFLSVLISYLNIEYVEPSKFFPKYTEHLRYLYRYNTYFFRKMPKRLQLK